MSDSGGLILLLLIFGVVMLILYAIAAIFGIVVAIAAIYGFIRTIINYGSAFKQVMKIRMNNK